MKNSTLAGSVLLIAFSGYAPPNALTRPLFLLVLSASLLFTASCESYRAASPETSVPETAVVEMTATAETTAAAVPTLTASPTPAETTAKKIPVVPINTSIRTDLPAPALYTVTGKTATGKTAVWANASRETASRYLVAGDTVTVVAIVGSETRPYALLDTGEYVLLGSLEAVPVATATPVPTATPAVTKPSKAPAKETKAPAATTAATTAPAATTTTAPAYTENCDNIKNLIIAKLQAKGLWYPDEPVIGDDSAGLSVGFFNSDDKYASDYVNGKFGQTTTIGVTSVSVWLEDGWLNISTTKCSLPTA